MKLVKKDLLKIIRSNDAFAKHEDWVAANFIMDDQPLLEDPQPSDLFDA